MSAHKRATVTIPEEEYRRLHEQEMREKLLPQADPVETRQAMAVLEESFNQMQQRQGEFQRLTSNFSTQLQLVEHAAAQTLVEQSAGFLDQLDTATGDLAAETLTALQQQAQDFSELDRQRREDMQALSTEMDHLASDASRKCSLAEDWLQTAAALLHFIDETYDHQQFHPARLEQLEGGLWLARENLQMQMPEAAFMAARQSYADLSNFRLRLEENLSRYEALQQAARLQLSRITEAAEQQRFTHALDLNGEALDFSLDVDFWSHRKLSRFFQTLTHLHSQLDDNTQTLDIPTLQGILNETLPALQSQLNEILFQARLNALNSQVRLNIADVVIQALGSQGFALQESEYSNGDMRRPFSARLVNLEGSEVLVEVDPLPGPTPTSDLQLHSSDSGLRTEHELRQRSLEVARALRRFGLQVGPLAPQLPHQTLPHPTTQPGRQQQRLPSTHHS